MTERQYWRSLDQLDNTPEFQELLHREFPEGITEPPQDPVSRRRFLGVVAAAVAMASMTSCRKPERKILPYAKRPEDTLPGIAEHYATSQVHDGYGIGVVMKSADGRPVKVEGNTLHPMSLGGASNQMQAEVLNLYDPARSKHPVDRRKEEPGSQDHGHGHGHGEVKTTTFADFEAFWANHGLQVKRTQGKGLAVLMAPTTSPTTLAMVEQFKRAFPKATVHTWAPLNSDNAIAATKVAFGHAMNPQYDLENAEVIVGFDSDHMECGPDSLAIARQIANARKLKNENDTLPRLYAIESYYALTGASADHRFRVRAHEIGDVVMALARELESKHGVNLAGIDTSAFKDKSWEYNGKGWIEVLAKDLAQNKGKSCLICGPGQPPAVQAMVHALNAALGNAGKTVSYAPTPEGMTDSQGDSIKALTTAMGKGEVQTLVCLGSNPVYNAPADLQFGSKFESVDTSIHLGLLEDETAQLCTWHVNQAHDLEAWGDIRSFDGTLSFVQPLVAPLFGGKSILEMLAVLAGSKTTSGYDLVQKHWQAEHGTGDFETWWARSLHDGVVPDSTTGTVPGSFRWSDVRGAVAGLKPSAPASKDSLEVCFRADYTLHDGRYSNNAWSQELPDPMHKLTWDNAALMSRRTAEDLGVWNEDLVKFTLDGREVTAPVWILPGHADNSVTFHLGYGRTLGHECQVAKGAGFNAYLLRASGAMHMATGMTASKTGRKYQLVTTQNHGSMEGRPVVRENTLSGYKADPEFAPNMSPLKDKKLNRSLWTADDLPPAYDYKEGYQWGMVIDLNACTGCNACVVACQAENNIPTVGKAQVAVGRAMHWNRLDRYFSYDNRDERLVGDVPPRREVPRADNPQVVHMMVPCQQCEKAPCEVVCPVAATTHSPEGLNDMVYNRCIGTRYCSNNCPFKVRRFNYLDFHGKVPETMQMAYNPDVTIRVRGVMEKCTYCVQRINGGKLKAKLEKRELRDGEVVTACAQSCPTQAITFGDINNEATRVHKLKQSNRNYAMLSELNIWPRTTYLAKIRNPNPELGA